MLSPNRDLFLKNFLEEEQRRVAGGAEERKDELRAFIQVGGSELADDNELDRLFENYLAKLPVEERPQTRPQERRLFNEWEGALKEELAERRRELATLESQSIDGQLIFNNARDRLMQLFEAEARDAGLFPQKRTQEMPRQESDEKSSSPASLDPYAWMTFVQVQERSQKKLINGNSTKPEILRNPGGVEVPINSWGDLLLETAEWLIREGLLTKEVCPVRLNRANRYLVHVEPIHPSGKNFGFSKELSNGLHMELKFDVKNLVRHCRLLLEQFGRDAGQFHVWLRQ